MGNQGGRRDSVMDFRRQNTAILKTIQDENSDTEEEEISWRKQEAINAYKNHNPKLNYKKKIERLYEINKQQQATLARKISIFRKKKLAKTAGNNPSGKLRLEDIQKGKKIMVRMSNENMR